MSTTTAQRLEVVICFVFGGLSLLWALAVLFAHGSTLQGLIIGGVWSAVAVVLLRAGRRVSTPSGCR